MGLARFFKVFRNASFVTERGEIKISRVFSTPKAAKKARYCLYYIDSGAIIYSRRTKLGLRKYAIIGD